MPKVKTMMENARMARGLDILKDESAVQRKNKFVYLVKSQSGEGFYTVKKQMSLWGCSCPDFTNRKNYCKHIYAVHYSIKMREMVKDEVKPRAPIDAAMRPVCCPSCHAQTIKKNGSRSTGTGQTQRYKCLSCGHRFTIDKGFNGMKNLPESILASVDLFFKGLSYRKIADHIKQFYGVEVAQTTPMRWVSKYLKMLGEYAEKNQPDVGRMWHSDEMAAKVNGKQMWIWNIMDNETRFLLACKLSEGRSVKEARAPIRDAKERAGKKPDFFVTDGLQSYQLAARHELGPLKRNKCYGSRHYRYKDFQTAPNNNILERLNGTVRERLKVMRGFDAPETAEATMAGFQTYYNYIREHSALGTTPAMQADIDLGLGENRWAGMVELIANQKQFGGQSAP
ncbi:MAG: IS6 family transposase [Euryarchaeota archaeon]|nr:IS6 family transposase [Euryarchaeota archaeon]